MDIPRLPGEQAMPRVHLWWFARYRTRFSIEPGIVGDAVLAK